MITHRHLILPCTLLLLLPLALTARADEIDTYIALQMRNQHIPGLSLAVVRDGKIVKTRGYGLANVELNVPARPETVYELASVSKQFTAAAIMLLVQDGKVALDDPIGKYIQGVPPTWKDVTLRRLLSHTSGLPREGIVTDQKNSRADFTAEEMVKSAAVLPMVAAPGERFSYSNLGYNLLGMVIEKASGDAYADFMRDRVFRPLGMTTTRINDRRAITPNRACGYEWVNGALRIGDLSSPTLYSGAGAIVSTVRDLAKWDAALYTDRLLNAASRRQIWTRMTLKNGKPVNYGFGWFISSAHGHTDINHDGFLAGFRSEISRFVDDKLTVIVLTNQTGITDPEEIATGVAARYIPELLPPHRDPVPIAADSLAAFAGRYEFDNNFLLTLKAAGGRLLGVYGNGREEMFLPSSDAAFFSTERDLVLTFVRGTTGDIVGVRVSAGNRLAPRIGPLIHTIIAHTVADSERNRNTQAALIALGQGGKAADACKDIAPGARKDFASPPEELADIRSLIPIADQDVADRGIERHGGKVSRVLTYKIVTKSASRYVLAYLTADNLLTDEDVVDD